MEIHKNSQLEFEQNFGFPFVFGASDSELFTHAFINSGNNPTLNSINSLESDNSSFCLQSSSVGRSLEDLGLPSLNQMGPFTLSIDWPGWGFGLGTSSGLGLNSALGMNSFTLSSGSNLNTQLQDASKRKCSEQETQTQVESPDSCGNGNVTKHDNVNLNLDDVLQTHTETCPFAPPPVSVSCCKCNRSTLITAKDFVIIPGPGDTAFIFKCSNCSNKQHAKLQHLTKTWTEVAVTAIYNLQLHRKRQYFHSKVEICDFIDKNWDTICTGKTRTSTWWATIHAQITQNKHLFQTPSYGSGYWGLCFEHPPEKFNQNQVVTLDASVVSNSHTKSKPSKSPKLQLEPQILKKRKKVCKDVASESSDDDFWFEADDVNQANNVTPHLLRSERERSKCRMQRLAERKQTEPQTTPSTSCVQIMRGLTCHQCRNRKTILANCTSSDCNKKYCEGCLVNHYNLNISALVQQQIWTCPFCYDNCSCISCKRNRGEIPEFQSALKNQKVRKSKPQERERHS